MYLFWLPDWWIGIGTFVGPEEELGGSDHRRQSGRWKQAHVLAGRARREPQDHRSPVRQQQRRFSGRHDTLRRCPANPSRRYPLFYFPLKKWKTYYRVSVIMNLHLSFWANVLSERRFRKDYVFFREKERGQPSSITGYVNLVVLCVGLRLL